MSSLAQSNSYIPENDYLEGEKSSQTRHEYVDGQVYAMAGSSKRHNRIAGNIYRKLAEADPNCEAYLSDIKVRISERKTYYYPDVVVSCEQDDGNDYYLENPCLIVEVLSDSTAQKDRTEKLLSYMNISSLRAYLLVSQDKAHIEMFYREPGGKWWVNAFENVEQNIELPCPDIVLTLSDIYSGVSEGFS